MSEKDPIEVPKHCQELVSCDRVLRLRVHDFDPEPSTDLPGAPDHIEPAGPVAEADCPIHGIQWSTEDPHFDRDRVIRV